MSSRCSLMETGLRVLMSCSRGMVIPSLSSTAALAAGSLPFTPLGAVDAVLIDSVSSSLMVSDSGSLNETFLR